MLSKKTLRCDFYIGLYSPSNGTMVNVVLRDLGLQGQTISHRSYGTVCVLWCWEKFVNYVNDANYANYMHNVFVRPCVRACILHKKCYFCTTNKRLDPDAPICAPMCKLISYLRLPIFIQILNVLDLHF